MKRILILILIGIIGYAGDINVSTPVSSDALEGKSVYMSPPGSVDVADEGCVQKEDQNVTGHGGAKKW
jgi:hypothetical protein